MRIFDNRSKQDQVIGKILKIEPVDDKATATREGSVACITIDTGYKIYFTKIEVDKIGHEFIFGKYLDKESKEEIKHD